MKRYRYILCGVVRPEDKLSEFRLVAANKIPDTEHTVIRVTIPENVKLTKWNCDAYSTAEDTDVRIKDCGPVPMVRYCARWTKYASLWPRLNPGEWHHELLVNMNHTLPGFSPGYGYVMRPTV